MTDWSQRQRRKQDVKDRASVPNHMFGYCRVIHCGRPARAGTSDGLDERYCRAHADHNQRHGSPLKGSYTARELNPYRRAALAWVVGHEDSRWVQNAVQRVQSLYQQAGPYIEAFRLRGLSPQDRAKAALARLRQHGIDPRLVVAAWLAVELVILDDLQPVHSAEYKRVQAAKVIHRMASGRIVDGCEKSPRPSGRARRWPRSRNCTSTPGAEACPASPGRGFGVGGGTACGPSPR
jgi:hypothetical protein